jgi:hypothetical protein
MVRETGCDAVMIGRAASSNPWIFRQIQQYLATGLTTEPTQQDRYEMMRRYYAMLIDRGEKDSTGKMKQFATYFTHGVRHGSQLRASIYQAQERRPFSTLVDEFFLEEPVLAHEEGSTDHRRRVHPAIPVRAAGRRFCAITVITKRSGAASRTPPTTAWN